MLCDKYQGQPGTWVRKVWPGGPAHVAGINEGDCVSAVDGASTEAMSILEVCERVKGHVDTSLTLKILRPDLSKQRGLLFERTLLRQELSRLTPPENGNTRERESERNCQPTLKGPLPPLATEWRVGPLAPHAQALATPTRQLESDARHLQAQILKVLYKVS
jgi:hypothetical protein